MKVSVIIPVWNGAEHIGEAIGSVLAQTRRPEELIVVDDGSTDDTPRVVRSFPGVRYFRQENSGGGPARNLGIRQAGGELLAFLDHDDLWCPGKLAAQVQLLDSDPTLDAAVGLVQNFVCPRLSPEQRARLRCPPDPIRGFSSTALLARRGAFEKAGWWPASEREGVEWFATARDAGVRIGEIPEIVAMRRLHASNRTRLTAGMNQDYARILHGVLARRRAATAASAGTPGMTVPHADVL